MKKMKFLFGMLAIGALLTSCNSDDDNTVPVDTSNQIEGSYKLIEFRTPNNTDINKDGVAHPNQMNETGCYNDSKVTLNADNTFSYEYRAVTVADGIASCSSATFNGTWRITGTSGSTINIRATYQNGENDTMTLDLEKTGNVISQTSFLAKYPDLNNSNVLVYSYGTVVLVFVK